MQLNIVSRQVNATLRTINTALLIVICVLFYQSGHLQIDSTVIQDRITNLNIYSEQRHNNLAASHDQLKNELENRIEILENRVKLLQGRTQQTTSTSLFCKG